MIDLKKRFLIAFILISAKLLAIDFPNELPGVLEMHDLGIKGQGQKVIVIDRGFQHNFKELIGNNSSLPLISIHPYIKNSIEIGHVKTYTEDESGKKIILSNQKDIKESIKRLEDVGININYNWESQDITSFTLPEKLSRRDKSELEYLMALINEDKEMNSLFNYSAHGALVTSVIVGDHAIAPESKVILIDGVNSESYYTQGDKSLSNAEMRFALELTKKEKISALNLSIAPICHDNNLNPQCDTQIVNYVILLKEIAKNTLVFYALDNEKNYLFGDKGRNSYDELLFKAAKELEEIFGYPRIFFISRINQETQERASAQAYLGSEFTLCSIGDFLLPSFTKENAFYPIQGTSFATPSILAQYLLLDQYMRSKSDVVTTKDVINVILQGVESRFKNKILPQRIYGRGFFDLKKIKKSADEWIQIVDDFVFVK